MQICKNCGAEATSEQRFCADCGVAIGEVKKINTDHPPAWIPHAPMPDPMINRMIGDRFQISNIVGRDLDGHFYTALDTRTTERVTVRVFFYRNSRAEEALGPRIALQAERLRSLDHRSIVRYRRVVREPDLLAVVLEWSGTATLETYISPPSIYRPETVTHQPRQRQISQRLLHDLLVEIFDATASMHSAGRINGYITQNDILIEDAPNGSKPRIRLCPLGSKDGYASSHPDRFHYDDDRLTEAADVWYLGRLVSSSEFAPITSPVAHQIAPIITRATLESRTNRIQTVRELKQGLAPLFRKRWPKNALPQIKL